MKLTTLKLFRRKRDLSQVQMADRLGVSLSLYEKVESGKMRPSKKFIRKFEIAFPHADAVKILFSDER